MNNGVKIQFLGGSDEVGRLAMVLELDGMKLLFEYGMAPGKPPLFPLPAPVVDRVLLTHTHLDHSGMIPWLCSQADQTIITTEITGKMSNLLYKDTIKIGALDFNTVAREEDIQLQLPGDITQESLNIEEEIDEDGLIKWNIK